MFILTTATSMLRISHLVLYSYKARIVIESEGSTRVLSASCQVRTACVYFNRSYLLSYYVNRSPEASTRSTSYHTCVWSR